jgi:hypothetical protein
VSVVISEFKIDLHNSSVFLIDSIKASTSFLKLDFGKNSDFLFPTLILREV